MPRKYTSSLKILSRLTKSELIVLLCVLVIALLIPLTLNLLHSPIQDDQHIASAATQQLPDGQGMYDSCSPWNTNDANNCFPRLDKMSTAGFKLVVNYQQMGGNEAGELAYLNHAQ